MKYLIVFLLFLNSCASFNQSEEKIKMPLIEKKFEKNNSDIISEASKNKVRIGEKNGAIFDFFYGPNGSYFIVISAKNRIDLSNYDISLFVQDPKGVNPETISLAEEDQQVLSGFGEAREGETQFELVLDPIDPTLSKAVKMPFKVSIKSFF